MVGGLIGQGSVAPPELEGVRSPPIGDIVSTLGAN